MGFDLGFDLEPTYRVSELNEEIQEVLGQTFRGLWVRGEVHRPRPSQRGHLYLELVEKGQGDQIVGKLDAVIWRTHHQRISRRLRAEDQRIADGMEIRCFGGLDYYGPAGRLQFVVREVDPLFTLGRLEQRRRETLQALRRADLLERNRELPLATLPLRIGLISSHDSAAYHDFMTGLEDSGYGFQVVFMHAAMQGPAAENEVASALRGLSEIRIDGEPLNAVVLTRGGGSKTDLAAFDSRAICEAICLCERPVICGLGHEIDQSLSDLVCRSSVKTPTKAAEFLVETIAEQDLMLRELRRDIVETAERRLSAARSQMLRAEPLVRLAASRLQAQKTRLLEISKRLQRSGERVLGTAENQCNELATATAEAGLELLRRAEQKPEAVVARIAAGAAARLAQLSIHLDGLERWCHSLSPERILERGFSLTFDDQQRLVKDPDQVRSGDRLTTQFAHGVVHSLVEPQKPQEPKS